MAKEWSQKCKDCGKQFKYSDTSLQRDLKKGLSRLERCKDCRMAHTRAIETIASSHFALKSRIQSPSILGYPYLGQIDHGRRIQAKSESVEPNMKGMDIGLNEKNIYEVYDALESNQVVIIMAPTGSGKSTYIPSKLLYPLSPKEIDFFTKNGPIIITQPRIAATIQIPNSIGEKFGGCTVGPGCDIGYCYSTDKLNYDLKRNRLVFTTDGSLINWIADGILGELSMVVIDEAHERSYNIESIINTVSKELLKYPDLKLMIISATIDSEIFRSFFAKTTKVKVLNFDKSEKTHGYEESPWRWKDLNEKKDFDEKIFEENRRAGEMFLDDYKSNIAFRLANKVLELANRTKTGGILAFLDGKDNINLAINIIREKLSYTQEFDIFPFHGELSDQERDDVIKYKFKNRRILIATNSAETSLTLEDIVYVVDSGIIKEEQWNSSTCRKSLETKFHSKAGCRQRWGRAGRVQKGFVEKLYSKEEFIKYFPNYTTPAVQRSNMEPMVLSAIASGQSDMDNYEMLTRPDDKEWQRAFAVIKERNLIDKDGDFTADGLEIYELSKAVGYILGDSKAEYNSTERSLDVACLLKLADKYTCLIEAATAIAMMPHMGNSLYWEMDGLFRWNKNLNLISKDYLVRMHESLMAGCIDDLDFSCKLYSLFEGTLFGKKLPKGYRNWFIKEYALNENSFAAIRITRNALISRFSEGKKNIQYRELNLDLVNRVRCLTALAWHNKTVSLKKVEGIVFENLKDKMVGIISDNCAGDWVNERKAIASIFDQNEVYATVEENKRQSVPVANFVFKYLAPVPKANVIDIINAFRKNFDEAKYEKQFSNLDCDLKASINTKVKIDSLSKPKKIISSFEIKQQRTNSENKEDLFVEVFHEELERENILEFGIDLKKEQKDENEYLIQQWKNIKGNPVALLERIPGFYSNQFDKLKVGDKIEATILRSIFNVRGIGIKEIVGFMISIEGLHYSLPVENIFIDNDTDMLKGLIGEKINLYKIGITPSTKQPIFSRTHLIEKEREGIFKLKEINAKIIRKSLQEILCQVLNDKLQYPHFVKVQGGNLGNDKKFIQLDGELAIKLNSNERAESVSIDCIKKPDLTNNEIQMIKNLLWQITSDKKKLNSFNKYGIEVSNTRLIANKRILFDDATMLAFDYPLISSTIKSLYSKSWELKGEILTIKKKVVNQGKIINNLAKNKESLAKANEEFTSLLQREEVLKEQIKNARTESFKEQRQLVLKENFERLVRKVDRINKLKSYIEEDEKKLKG